MKNPFDNHKRELKRVDLSEVPDMDISEQLRVGTEGVYSGEHMKQQYPLLSDLGADMRLDGFPSGLAPYSNKTSSSRESMFASHLGQSIIVKGCEHPRQFTGEERDLANYTINPSRREEPVEILEVIPKYAKVAPGVMGAKELNYWMILCRGLDTNEISYFTLERIADRYGEWGYENQFFEKNIRNFLQPGQLLPKEVKLSEAPDFKGSRYGSGVNLNVAYMTTHEVLEDAMVISESAAKRLGSTIVDTVPMIIHPNYIPINLYGETADSPKFFPDVGECVRSDGIIAAFRKVNVERFAGDVCEQNISRVDPANDIILRAPAGARITDVNFWVNRGRREDAFPQIKPYLSNLTEYHRRILETYNKYKNSNLSSRFRSLVRKAILSLAALGENPKELGKIKNSAIIEGIDNKPVEFIHGTISYIHDAPATRGTKLSDRQGSKGVVAAVKPDKDMPVDQYGIRADLIMDPASPVKRVNAGQFFEQGINRISEFVRRKVEETYKAQGWEAAYKVALEWYFDVHPSYGWLISTRALADKIEGPDGKVTYKPNPKKEEQHVKDIIEEGFFLMIRSFLTTITMENIKTWIKKWDVPVSPITFNMENYFGEMKTYTTRDPILIGEKYIIRLCRDPIPTSSGVSTVSHHGIPIAPPKITRRSSLIRLKPARLGEDEQRVLAMDINHRVVTRFKRLTGQSPACVKQVITEIMKNPHPTQIAQFDITDEEAAQKDMVTSQTHHYNRVAGVDLFLSLVEKKFEPLSQLEAPAKKK